MIEFLQGRVVRCLEMIQESKSSMRVASATTTTTTTTAAGVAMANSTNVVPRSPNGVLDAACLSYKSDETTVGSCPSSSHTSPITKRRKLEKTTTLGGDSWSNRVMWNLDSHIKNQVVGEWEFWCVKINKWKQKNT